MDLNSILVKNRLNRETKKLAILKIARKEIQAKYNKQRDQLIKDLKANNLTKYDDKHYTVTYVKPRKTKAFSTPLVRKLAPSIYKNPKFHKIRNHRGFIRIKHDDTKK